MRKSNYILKIKNKFVYSSIIKKINKMAKVILEFDAVEDQDDIRTALDGYKWKLAMWDLDQELRKTTKYAQSHINHGKEACSVEDSVAERYREMIREILTSYGIMLD